jgi:N-acylneuraminate cytidylyltransferase
MAYQGMPVCAIIPARGGSKGIPRKNIVPLHGKPLLAYSVEHALQSRYIDRVIVSTEDAEIAHIAREWGAETPFQRPLELAGDAVLDLPVFAHALEWLEAHDQYTPPVVVHLRPTAPLRAAGQIDAAVELLISDPQADSVRSVSVPTQHPYRMFQLDDAGYLRPLLATEHPEPYLLRRQDLPDVYWYNCVIDVTRRQTIFEQHSMTGRRIRPYLIDSGAVVDIDGPDDLLVAEAKIQLFYGT